MTDQEYFEKRKPLQDSIQFDDDDDKPITRRDLRFFSKDLEIMFKEMEASISRQINEHKQDCELCKGKFLTIDNCYAEWKVCHDKHNEESAQQTTARLSRFKDYREFFVWVVFGGYVIFQALDWNKLFELIK